MVSPYIQRECERLGIGSKADHQRVTFAREQARYSAPLERTDPVRSLARDAIEVVAFILIIIIAFEVPDLIAAVMK